MRRNFRLASHWNGKISSLFEFAELLFDVAMNDVWGSFASNLVANFQIQPSIAPADYSQMNPDRQLQL